MNELKEELDIIFDLTQTAYIKDGKIVPFVAPISYEKELKRKIMQLIETYTAKKELEELNKIAVKNLWEEAGTYDFDGIASGVFDRINQLSSQLKEIK